MVVTALAAAPLLRLAEVVDKRELDRLPRLRRGRRRLRGLAEAEARAPMRYVLSGNWLSSILPARRRLPVDVRSARLMRPHPPARSIPPAYPIPRLVAQAAGAPAEAERVLDYKTALLSEKYDLPSSELGHGACAGTPRPQGR